MSFEAIMFKEVTKVYSKYVGLQKVKNFLDKLKNAQLGKELVREAEFYALNKLNLNINKGEYIGIIGPNGAGKSTILKIISRIAFPTSGEVSVMGHVGGLIELGAGFHPDLTGRDNVYLNAALNGFSKKHTSEIFKEILDISELHHYIDVPIKKYSSGMVIRLGFAVVMATNPDIVLLDEVLAVGDAKFQQKSLSLMQEYISDKTVVFVSHSMAQIKEICTRVIVLDHGTIFFNGDCETAIEAYNQLNNPNQPTKGTQVVLTRNVKRGFSEVHKVEVKSVELIDYENRKVETVMKGDRVIIQITLKILEVKGGLFVKIMIKKLVMDKFSEIIDEYRIKIPENEIYCEQQVINVSFNSGNLRAGNYVIEIIPQFTRQSTKSAIAVFTHPFIIQSDTTEQQCGLVDLEFEVENLQV